MSEEEEGGFLEDLDLPEDEEESSDVHWLDEFLEEHPDQKQEEEKYPLDEALDLF